MKVAFKGSFARDLRKIKNKAVHQQVKEAIEQVEQAPSLRAVSSLKHLKSGGNYYRIRIGDYRIGLLVEKESVVFVRCLPRRDVYKYFP